MDVSRHPSVKWQRWLQDNYSRETLPQSFKATDSHGDFVRNYSTEGEAKTKEAIDISTQKLQEAIRERDSWKGRCKGAKSLQRFLIAFSTFIDEYSGIIEILKLVDNHFGAIAYSTLSVLLKKTAVNKKSIEYSIQDEMEGFQRAFPRVNRLYKLDPTEEIAHHIDILYSNILLFARACIFYFNCNPLRRIGYAMLNRLPKRIDETAKKIHIHLEECERESIIISQERLRNVEDQIAAHTKTNQQAELNKIYQLFRPGQADPTTIKFYKKALLEPSGSLKHYRRFTFDLLLSEPTYIRWKETNRSSLLVLKGRTLSQRDGHSWLSLSMLGLIDNLEICGPISYFIQTDPWRHCAPPAYLVITNIIWQLLESKPEVLTKLNIKKDIEENIQHGLWQAKLPFEPCKVLTELLRFFPTTYILLDRLDRCSCSFDNLLPIILDVVKKAESVVKILVIVDEGNAEVENYMDFSDQLEIITLHQTQERVAS